MAAIRDLLYHDNGQLNWIGKGLAILVILLATWVVMSIIRYILNRFNEKNLTKISSNKAKTVNNLLYNVLRAVIYFVMITLILDLFGINTTSIIAAAGVGGVALAFGAQAIIADAISGFFLILDDEINVGDYVVLQGDYAGTIIAIHLRRTLIQAYSGAIYSIPNSEIKTIANFVRRDIQCDVSLPIPYDLSVDQVKDTVDRVAQITQRDYPDLFTKHPYYIGVAALNEFTYQVNVGGMTKPGNQWTGERTLRELFLKELDHVGINSSVTLNEVDDEQI